jgi:hypothetical protein
MYDGLTNLDIKKIFSFGFYSYGFGFFFLNLLATTPFFASDNIEMTIYIPRIITSLFAIGSLWFIYKIAFQYIDKYSSILITLIVLSMPGFWRNSLWFHPDWMMTFFIILSVYLFKKDGFNYKKYYWWAIFSLGIAISVKIQAITFLPFVLFYIFYDNFQNKSFDKFYSNIKLLFKSFVALLVTFVIANPYLMHPVGLKVFIGSFVENMKSNATNHGLDVKVTISDKLYGAIDFYYLNSVLFVIVFCIALYLIFSTLKKSNQKSIFPLISLYFIANIVYLFLMVNKGWQHYYLTIFTVVPLLFVFLVNRYETFKYFILGGVILIQVVTHISEYKYVLTNGYHLDKQKSVELKNKMSDLLVSDLKTYIDKDTNILISAYQPFAFRDIGLTFKNMHVIYGPISKSMFNLESYIEGSISKDTNRFKEKEFIIISKLDEYFNEVELAKRVDKQGYKEALKIIENFNTAGDLGYGKFKENQYFYIWKKK